MSDFMILHARADGSFVVERNGQPYHVVEDDPLFDDVAEAATGRTFPPEAPPAPAVQPGPRFIPGAAIAAAVEAWGAAGDAALDALTSRQWFALSAGVPEDHPALAALLDAAGKTMADIG